MSRDKGCAASFVRTADFHRQPVFDNKNSFSDYSGIICCVCPVIKSAARYVVSFCTRLTWSFIVDHNRACQESRSGFQERFRSREPRRFRFAVLRRTRRRRVARLHGADIEIRVNRLFPYQLWFVWKTRPRRWPLENKPIELIFLAKTRSHPWHFAAKNDPPLQTFDRPPNDEKSFPCQRKKMILLVDSWTKSQRGLSFSLLYFYIVLALRVFLNESCRGFYDRWRENISLEIENKGKSTFLSIFCFFFFRRCWFWRKRKRFIAKV